MPRVTMKDVAREAGVSMMTVSRAFKMNSSVGDTTRARIMEAAHRLGYVFDTTASNLRARRTDFLAVVVPSINNANFADTVAGLSEEAEDLGLQPLLAYTNYDMAREETAIVDLLRRRPMAITLTGGNHTPHARTMLEGAGIPVIETWDLPPDPLGHVVGFSNAACMETLVEHLVTRGRERIAFIGGDSSSDTRGADRRRGFARAMEQRGLDAGRLIAAGVPPISMREGAEAMERLLRSRPDTEAVICVSDVAAFGALSECQRRGIAVPDDMAIAGFGAYEISEVCLPRLTTVDASSLRIGREAGQILKRIAAGEIEDGPVRVEIEPNLVVGGTT